jgi:predicted transcriptional regulator
MKRIEISVLSPEEALRAFAESWRQAEMAEEMPIPRLVFGSFGELFSEITESRLKLLHRVASDKGRQPDQLARSLGRPVEELNRDLTALLELGLLKQDEDGVLSAPYDEILIHADIRNAA